MVRHSEKHLTIILYPSSLSHHNHVHVYVYVQYMYQYMFMYIGGGQTGGGQKKVAIIENMVNVIQYNVY